MIVDENQKNISNQDLEAWAKYASLGSIGVIFLSKSFEPLNSSLLEFFVKCHSTVDSVVILTPENTLNKEDIKIITLLPFIAFFCSNDNILEFVEKMKCNHFLKLKDEKFPEPLDNFISNLKTAQVHEF
jgi:hypothetical protein